VPGVHHQVHSRRVAIRGTRIGWLELNARASAICTEHWIYLRRVLGIDVLGIDVLGIDVLGIGSKTGMGSFNEDLWSERQP